MVQLLSPCLSAAVVLLTLFGMSTAAYVEDNEIYILKKLDQKMQQSYGLKLDGSLLETHATFSKMVEEEYRLDSSLAAANLVVALNKIWQLDYLDCERNFYLGQVFDYHRKLQSNPDCVSKAFREYATYVFNRAVDHCTSEFSANKWKLFLQSVPSYEVAKRFNSLRKKAIKLMGSAIDGTEPADVMLNKMADRVREFRKKSWTNENDLGAAFEEVSQWYEKLFFSMNYRRPASDAPNDVKKLHLLWLVWSKKTYSGYIDFLASRSVQDQGLLKFIGATNGSSIESGIASCSKTFQMEPQEVRKRLERACESLDKRAAAIANLVDALELASRSNSNARAAIYCSKFNSVRGV